MGVACFSKPLSFVRLRPTTAVHPELNDSAAVSGCTDQTQLTQYELATGPASATTSFCTTNIPNHERKLSVFGGRFGTGGVSERKRSPRNSKVWQTRAPSVTGGGSDTSSVLGFGDGLAGLYALASLTDYELKLIPSIWQSCLSNNAYYCEHVVGRLLTRHPELEDMFDKENIGVKDRVVGDKASDAQEIIHTKAAHLNAFFKRLITIHQLDYDRLLEECERVGRSHAVYHYERSLQPYHWDGLAYTVIQEYKKTQMDADLNTDEKELQQLAWMHFVAAVSSAIKESFEDEIRTNAEFVSTDH